ncbi:hypothetical protein F5J12DRAFT_892186 [Pisolithus orientalis]|uniref:uncharacterized protein n=1 Tax=Pisolithus orientalis TaxID=936130 RepID=UPI002224419C|nr:uncharacterized protein F5J12DRAFT_892186 [Pisolithus orientalis]KAI6008182.1 hypothetical protein F5J12DRAFT_892186 [Pisolithus orientalis]
MAKEFTETLWRTMGVHVVMFASHETPDAQIKMAILETAPPDGKKAFSVSSEPTKDWVLKGEQMLTDYLLTEPGKFGALSIKICEEDLNDKKQAVEIALDDEGNPQVPAFTGQKLKAQQSLARAVFQAAYAKFTRKPKAKVPWGLLIKSPLEYLDSTSIPDGFVMKDPSKWTKADLRLLWNHWHSLENEDKVITSFINCKKDDKPLGRPFHQKTSRKKRVWVSPDDDNEAGGEPSGVAGASDSEAELETGGVRPSKVTPVVQEDRLDSGASSSQNTPHDSSPAWHANGDQMKFLKTLSIMPRYQDLIDLGYALPETANKHIAQEPDMEPRVGLPEWAPWTWSAQYLPQEIHANGGSFWKALGQLQSQRFTSRVKGLPVVLGFGMLWRECKRAQEVEEDDPEVANLGFLLDSKLDISRGKDVMAAVGVVIARLVQNSGDSEEQGGSGKKTGGDAEHSGDSGRGGEEKEPEDTPQEKRKRKRGGSGNVERKKKKTKGGSREDGVQEKEGKRPSRCQQPTKRALGQGL